MSILMGVLSEELDRLNRQQIAYERDLQDLPKGYISKKNIRGKTPYYLQWRDGGKIVGKYISAEDLPKIEGQIKQRKQLEAALRRVKADRKKLRRVLA